MYGASIQSKCFGLKYNVCSQNECSGFCLKIQKNNIELKKKPDIGNFLVKSYSNKKRVFIDPSKNILVCRATLNQTLSKRNVNRIILNFPCVFKYIIITYHNQ